MQRWSGDIGLSSIWLPCAGLPQNRTEWSSLARAWVATAATAATAATDSGQLQMAHLICADLVLDPVPCHSPRYWEGASMQAARVHMAEAADVIVAHRLSPRLQQEPAENPSQHCWACRPVATCASLPPSSLRLCCKQNYFHFAAEQAHLLSHYLFSKASDAAQHARSTPACVLPCVQASFVQAGFAHIDQGTGRKCFKAGAHNCFVHAFRSCSCWRQAQLMENSRPSQHCANASALLLQRASAKLRIW